MEAVPGQGQLTPADHRGTAAELHSRVPVPEGEAVREAWWLHVTRPAVVLGSTQRDETVDVVVCVAAGVDIVRRRSGGGAVLMIPGEIMWLDVIVPRDDPLWVDDIGRSMWWLGHVWADALRALGVGAVEVHHGALVQTRWSRLVCFDGLGAGEVTVGGRKAVGISQRRTRQWSRLQSTLHLAWRPEVLLGLLARPKPTREQLRDVWTVPADIDAAAVRAAWAGAGPG